MRSRVVMLITVLPEFTLEARVHVDKCCYSLRSQAHTFIRDPIELPAMCRAELRRANDRFGVGDIDDWASFAVDDEAG